MKPLERHRRVGSPGRAGRFTVPEKGAPSESNQPKSAVLLQLHASWGLPAPATLLRFKLSLTQRRNHLDAVGNFVQTLEREGNR